MSNADKGDKRRSVVQSLPSDYSDVQPRGYDPEYISQISNSMQVPDSIPVLNGDSSHNYRRSMGGWGEEDDRPQQHNMKVPERIMLAGGGQHIGAKPEIRNLNFDTMPQSNHIFDAGLTTPPRTLTIEEQFPMIESDDDQDDEIAQINQRIPNGQGVSASPEPYTPGMSHSDSMMVYDEGESAQLRKHVIKLTRQVSVMSIEQRNLQKNQRIILLGAGLYMMMNICKWLLKDK